MTQFVKKIPRFAKKTYADLLTFDKKTFILALSDRNTRKEHRMYSIHVGKWQGKITENKYNKTTFAKELGVSRNTLEAYFKKPTNVPYHIIAKSAVLLHLNRDDMTEVFFTQELTQTAS